MRDPEKIYLSDAAWEHGYSYAETEEMIRTNTWEYEPEADTFPALVKEKWPELFLRAVRDHKERQIATIEREIKDAEFHHYLTTTPFEHLSPRHQKIHRLWQKWGFITPIEVNA